MASQAPHQLSLARRAAIFHQGLRAALAAQAVVGSLLGLSSALIIPALQFRLEAQRDASTFAVFAIATTLFAAVEAALVAAWTAGRADATVRPRGVRRVRRRELLLAFLFPVTLTAGAVQARGWLVLQEDPLYGYVERGLARALAQRGIGSEARLGVEDGKLTLAVPTWLERHGAWWIEIDASDTAGRRCTLHSDITFGEDPVVLRVPVPLASDQMPGHEFSLVPGTMVVVRGIRLSLDPRDPTLRNGEPVVFLRELALVYEVPQWRGGGRSTADYVTRARPPFTPAPPASPTRTRARP